jgi:hypothetical protein
VLTDPNNCGACGAPCRALPNASASCSAGNCLLGACNAGFADCNHNPIDGCEVDLASDGSNCNACGNVCPLNNPFCNQGVCGQSPPAVVFAGGFTQGQASPQQCQDWNAFRGRLGAGPYSTITIKGSQDQIGVSCTGQQADQLCQALRNNQAISVNCNSSMWSTGMCGPGIELTQSAGVCQCNNGYTVDPCINNLNWGGVNGTSCGAPSQTITVLCQQ